MTNRAVQEDIDKGRQQNREDLDLLHLQNNCFHVHDASMFTGLRKTNRDTCIRAHTP